MPRTVLLTAAMTLALAPVLGAAEAPTDGAAPATEAEAKSDVRRVDWHTDLAKALRDAASWNRPVLVYFHADWSQPCRWVDEGSFSSAKLAAYVERYFIPVRIDDTAKTNQATIDYDIRVYPTVLFLGPQAESLHIVLGPRSARQLYDTMENVRVLPDLMRTQADAPEDVEANFALGNALARLNQLLRAKPYLEQVIRLDPSGEHGRLSQASLILATVPLEEGNSEEALANLDRFLRHFRDAPEVPVAIYYRGTILFRDGKLEAARKEFERLQREFPKHRQTYLADKAIDAIDVRLKAREVDPGEGADVRTPEPGVPDAETPEPGG